MSIHGLNKLTLLDYPGKVAATIFLGKCNFRCPFCHNADLVIVPSGQPVIEMEEILKFLKKRQGILEGVCVTGGEPTLYPELEKLIREIRSLGYAVKLDTNGYRPSVMKHLIQEGLLDMVAMDIKSDISGYGDAAGVNQLDISRIEESVRFLMEGHIPYEFRTTVVKELHNEETFENIGKWIEGCENYYLQCYKDSGRIIAPGFHAYGKEELEAFRQILTPYIKKVELRGID